MRTRFVTATEFKAKCLGLIDEIESTRETITVTKRGRPVAVIAPAKRKPFPRSMGLLAGKAKIKGDIVNTSHLWEHFGKGQG
jgi:prevent-host-death family protein